MPRVVNKEVCEMVFSLETVLVRSKHNITFVIECFRVNKERVR